MYAISHDLEVATAQRFVSIAIAMVVASVVAHGISVTPLMNRFEKRRKGKSDASGTAR